MSSLWPNMAKSSYERSPPLQQHHKIEKKNPGVNNTKDFFFGKKWA
jgi:hypothetical protein